MPAPPKYPSAHAQMFELAVQARQRGFTFDEFWEIARRPDETPITVSHPNPPAGIVLFPTDTADRRAAIQALDATKERWRSAYERRPPAEDEWCWKIIEPVLDAAEHRLAREFGSNGNGRQLAVA